MSEVMYWNGKGKHQEVSTKLEALIPSEGACDNARTTNKKLDKFRRASNCYYDLFNNGLCNRAAEFRRVFGFGGTNIAKSRVWYSLQLEQAMDKIILEAAKEQGLIAG